MQKQQSKGITLKHEIKKEKTVAYPYHLISCLYQTQQDYNFLITVDYFSDTTILVANPFRKDMTKLGPSSINLNGILPRRIVTTIYVKKLNFKPTSNGASIISGEFVLGYASGQVAVVQYKDKDSSIKARLNKSLKGEGFLSKTSSFFFGGEDIYSTYFKEPVKSFHVNQNLPDLLYSYQIGNNIMFLNELSQSNQYNFFNIYESNTRQNYMDQYVFNVDADKGSLQLFCCSQYYSLRDTQRKIGMIKFEDQVACYQFLNPARKELVVALSTKETILLISTVKFHIIKKISTETPIRRISSFQHKNEQFLAILVYSNHVVLYNINQNKYLKLIGHRSFTGGIMYEQSEQMIISSGMDHRVSLIKFAQVKQNSWNTAFYENEKCTNIQDFQAAELKYPEIFSLGQYNNIRTNSHSYGFAGIFKMGNLFCMPTYDARILFYKYG